MADTLKVWRCTRSNCYPHGTPLNYREGHYVYASSEEEAHLEIVRRFPDPGERFTITLWRDKVPAHVRAEDY